MKNLLNREFLDLAGERNYPLEEGALGVSDGGDKYPDNILSDAQIVVDPSLGNSIFILSCAVGSELVTVTFAASDEVDTGGVSVLDAADYEQDYSDNYTDNLTYFGYQTSFLENTSPTFLKSSSVRDSIIPIGVAVASKQDIKKGLPISIEALQDGVSGSVIFDSNTFENIDGSWTFSRYHQSALSRRSYHIMGINRVQSISVDKVSDIVAGDVSIEGENGLTATVIKNQEITVGTAGETIIRDTISIGFTGELAKDQLERYSGLCATRPDSNSCILGKPILSINGVTPIDATTDTYDKTIFVLFPSSLKPYILELQDSAGDPLESGIVIDSTDIPVNVVCGPRFPDIDDEGHIGTDDCCSSSDCDKDCEQSVGVAGARKSMYFDPQIAPGMYAHVCLHTSQLVYHEYNLSVDGVDRTDLTLIGGVGEEYIYAENVSDLASGIVVYINVLSNTFRMAEDGVQSKFLTGDLSTSQCRTANIVYIDGSEDEIELTIAPVSILDTIDTSRHSLTVSLTVSPLSDLSITDPFEANGEFCERQYGIYRTEDVLYDDKYVIDITPYDNYPFRFLIQDKGTQLLTTGNFTESGGVLTVSVDFNRSGKRYYGTIVSSTSTCST